MFKDVEYQKSFVKVLLTYISEFGAENVILTLPRSANDNVDRGNLPPGIKLKFWKRNCYQVKVVGFTAHHEMELAEDS